MSVPKDRGPDPHADPLIAAVLRAAAPETAGPCPDAEVLALYAERELPGDEFGTVESHVVACARCQATVAAYLNAAPDLDALGAVGGTAPVPWWAGWRWLVPLASASAVLAVTVWIGRGPADQVAEQARVTAPAPEAEAAPRALEPSALDTPAERSLGRDSAAAPNAAAEQERSRPQPAIVEQLADQRRDAAANSLAVPVREAVRPSPATAAAGAAAEAAAKAAPPTPAAPAASSAGAGAAATAARADDASRGRASVEMAAPAAAPSPAARAENAGNMVGAAAAVANDLATLTGAVTHRARVALPAGAVVDVRLLDVSRADAPATTLARAEIVTRGEQVPLPFTLRYDAAAIQPGRRYLVQATITVDGRVTWRTTTQHAVFAAGAAPTAPITVVVDAVR